MMNLPTKGSMDLSSKNWDFPSLRRWTKQHWGIWPHDVVLRKIEGYCTHAFFHGQTIGDTSQKDFITCILWKPCALWKNPLVHKQQTKKMEFQARKTKYEKGLECQPQNTRDMDCNTEKNRTYPKKMTEFPHVSTTKTAPTPQPPPLPRRHGSHGSGDSRNLCGTWPSEARPSSERQWYVTRWTDSTWKPPGDGIWMGVWFIYIHSYIITLHYKTLH